MATGDNTNQTLITNSEIDDFVSVLKKSQIKDIGTLDWWNRHEKQQRLSQQAIAEIETGLGEGVKRALINTNKISTLVHEAICISVWREQVFPKLIALAEKEPSKNFLIYMVLYHETTAVSLLEASLFHSEACMELGDSSIDLIDYCISTITSLVSKKKHSQGDLEDSGETSPQLLKQESKLTFGVGIRCIAIIQYLAEHLESLPLSATTRMYQSHDLPMLLVHLIVTAPWVMKDQSGKVLKYSDDKWHQPRSSSLINQPEAHTWLAIHQLLLFKDLGTYYSMTEFARNNIMKLNGYLTDEILKQLPPLQELKRGILCLSQFQLPVHRKPLILEIIPEIRNTLLAEDSNEWKTMTDLHVNLLIRCSDKHAAFVAQSFCESLSGIFTASSDKCTRCNKPAKNRCSRCKISIYCGRQCQVLDYPQHKVECKVPNC